MLPSMHKIGVIIDFQINEDFISEVLCINKDKPSLKCNGKCYLSAKLKEAEKQEDTQPAQNQKEIIERVLYVHKKLSDIFSILEVCIDKNNICYRNIFIDLAFVDDIFQPPKLM